MYQMLLELLVASDKPTSDFSRNYGGWLCVYCQCLISGVYCGFLGLSASGLSPKPQELSQPTDIAWECRRVNAFWGQPPVEDRNQNTLC